jgi:peroxiredoxin
MDWRLYRMARRVTFLISPAGKIHQVFQGVDPDRHADVILAALTPAAQ